MQTVSAFAHFPYLFKGFRSLCRWMRPRSGGDLGGWRDGAEAAFLPSESLRRDGKTAGVPFDRSASGQRPGPRRTASQKQATTRSMSERVVLFSAGVRIGHSLPMSPSRVHFTLAFLSVRLSCRLTVVLAKMLLWLMKL